MRDYLLKKREYLGIPIKEIIYNFEIKKTNNPTKWIKIIIHHTKNRKSIQDIINLHVKKNRWSEIGYHFMIGKKGQIYLSRSLDVAGAHTFGYNRNSIGIALFGNLDDEKPTEKQLESLDKLIFILKKEFSIRKVLGHNEAIYEQIKKYFWKLDLPKLDLTSFGKKEDFEIFMRKVTDKTLNNSPDEKTIRLIKKLTTCPGFNMYKILKIYK